MRTLFILFGGPGLIVGAIVGAVLPKWRILIALIAVGAVGTWFGFNHFAAQEGDENHPLGALAALTTLFNFAGCVVGLITGAVSRRVMRRRSG